VFSNIFISVYTKSHPRRYGPGNYKYNTTFFIFLKKYRRISKVMVSFVSDRNYPRPNYIPFLDKVWQGRSTKVLSIQAQL